MKIKDIQFKDYGLLSDEERNEIDFALKYAEPIQIDCERWTFGDVKMAQQVLSKEFDEEAFEFLMSKIFENYLDIKYHIVFLSLRGIIKSIEAITEKENKAMFSFPDPKATAALEKVGGFERFGRFPEIIAICKEFGWTYEYVSNLEWSIAFSIAFLQHKQNEFQKEYYRND